MKKKLFILALLFVSVFTFFVNNFNSNSEELGVRDVYIEDNKYDLSYFENKYDIYNDDISSFEMNETYDSTNNILSNNSLEDEYKIEYNVEVNKFEQCFTFSYILYINNKIELTFSVKVDVIKYADTIYLLSGNGITTTLDNLLNDIIETCANSVLNARSAFGLDTLVNLMGGNCGSGGLGLGLGLIAAGALSSSSTSLVGSNSSINSSIDDIIASKKGSGRAESSSSTTVEFNTIDDVLDGTSLGQEMKNKNFKKEDLMKLLALMLGLGETTDLTKFYKSDNKVLCIGRDNKETWGEEDRIDGYQNYSKANGFWAFWSKKYDDYIEEYTKDLMELANDALIEYCCLANWDFILVTNPYYYIEGRYTGQYGGLQYCKELNIIRLNGYNKFQDVDEFNNTLTWQTIKPKSLDIAIAHFEYAGYRVKKGV